MSFKWPIVRYDRKPFDQIESQILTFCVEQRRHRDFFEVRRTAAPKRHTKYKRPKQTVNHVDIRIAPPPDPEDLSSKPIEICPVTR